MGEDGHLTADVEGMAIYRGANGAGYLIVSSQGSSEFMVYERTGRNRQCVCIPVLAARQLYGRVDLLCGRWYAQGDYLASRAQMSAK